jgi:hypothetical protein
MVRAVEKVDLDLSDGEAAAVRGVLEGLGLL